MDNENTDVTIEDMLDAVRNLRVQAEHPLPPQKLLSAKPPPVTCSACGVTLHLDRRNYILDPEHPGEYVVWDCAKKGAHRLMVPNLRPLRYLR